MLVWAFIGQVLDPDQSCNRALARIQAYRARLGLKPLSTDTGGYCKARKRLPEALFRQLFQRTGAGLSQNADARHLWCNRRVKVVDGSSSSMPDTPANQKTYPQPCMQKPGCGFPVVAFVGVFCLATGAALHLALGPWFLHDLSLFYFARHAFSAGDIMLADRGFCSYAEIALMQQRNVDTVMRLHQRRKTDFRRGRILGLEDHVVVWNKPLQCSQGLRQKDYRRLPATLTLREIRYRVAARGFRTREITLVTTLLDCERYNAESLADLYGQRWDVELDFRHLKTTMQMDVLRGKTPDIVRKEIWTHLLAYNLIRAVMWEAAETQDAPRRISVKGTIQHVLSLRDLFVSHRSIRRMSPWFTLLHLVAGQQVPCRPQRFEPRVKKRRPKNYPLMTKPRSQLKAVIGG